MRQSDEHTSAVTRAVNDVYSGKYDDIYDVSPHVRHRELRELLQSRIRGVVREVLARQKSCDVLELGAGHGTFTETVVQAGGRATVTEMSRTSFEFLQRKFRDAPEVRVVYDPDGDAPVKSGEQFDVILLISVIHHIPDYIAAITVLCDKVLKPQGSVVTFQDPLWYPRQGLLGRSVSWLSYMIWRLGQGELRRGVKTQWRRARGVYDESHPSDMVEYHVIRQGVDEQALVELFGSRFADVELDSYFSTGVPTLHSFGAKHFPPNNFGIVARGRK